MDFPDPRDLVDVAGDGVGALGDGLEELGGALEDAGGAALDAGGYVLDKAGDAGLLLVSPLNPKSMAGLWDVVEDGFDLVMGAVHECMQWLWDQVPDFILRPVGDDRPLQAAAAAWRGLASDIEQTRDDLVAGGRTLRDWKGPAADRFDDYLSGLLKEAKALGEGIEKIAKALTDAAAALRDLNRLVQSVVAEITATIAVGVILTAITGGVGAAALAAQVAAMVARVTSAIRRAVAVVRRVLPILREAKALKAVERFTTRTDNVFDAFKTGKVVTKLDNALDGLNKPVGRGTRGETTRGDILKNVVSTGVGNAVGTSVSSGKDPSQWGTKEIAGAGLGTVVSVRLGSALKPLWMRTRRGPDGVVATATTSAGSSALTDAGVQVVTGHRVDLGKAARAGLTGGATGGASRSANFYANGQGLRGRTLSDQSIRPKGFEKPGHVKNPTSKKLTGPVAEGVAKGVVTQLIDPKGQTGPVPAKGAAPRIDDVPRHPFGRPTYTVRPGDDLSTIAQAMLGDGNRWRELVSGAHPAISDPDLIQPGQVISLPR